MTAAATPASGKASRGWRLADRRIRAKLALLLVTPVTAILFLSGLIAYGAQSAAAGAEQARQLVALSQLAGQLAGQLQQERASAALVLTRSAGDAAVDGFQQQTQQTDTAGDEFSAALSGVRVPPGLQPVISRVQEQLTGLPLLREQVRSGQDATASVIVFRYRALIADLLAYRATMSQLGVDADTADGLRASATLSQAIEGLALVQVGALPAIGTGTLTSAEQQQLVANDASFAQGLEDFRQLAPAQWQAQLSALTGNRAVVSGERLQALAVSAQPSNPLELGTTPTAFAAALGARMTQLHGLENEVDASLVRDVTAQRDRERRQIMWLGGAVLLALALVTVSAWRLSRSMTRPLDDLHWGATDLANRRLPGIVNELIHDRPDEHGVADAVQRAGRALPVHGNDEVGKVAVALNDVAAVAARLAGEQAALRALTYQIMRSLAYRFQAVVDQITASMDRLELDEQDPARLELLFAADQQATSARRTVNNLLVIAGARPKQSVDHATSVQNVVKAAISWAEGASTRVDDSQVTADWAIVPDAVDAIVHILTELLGNALYFSPPNQFVSVSGVRLGDLLYVHIDDCGVGMPAERKGEIERDLADFDLASAARHMGIPVIGRLAAPLGVKVSFRDREMGGTSAEVIIPSSLLVDVDPPDVPVIRGLPEPARYLSQVPAADSPQVIPPATLGIDRRLEAAPTQSALIEDTALLPVAGRQPASAEGSPRLDIYDAVVHDSPYFRSGDSGEGVPMVPQVWRDGQAAAEAAQRATAALATVSTGADRSTPSGLPVRRPGQFTIPAPATAAPVVPAQRNRAATRRGMAALTRTAARTSTSPSSRQIG
ncbi:nitrate- and nitrite sensing domain-containing protein [Actinoplanes sp. NPDC051411]|uniref:sensor histidine kinase n=1 Tax=Actinoplanes sp. NPDC051411 TaxID=3155522 RepID=UPI0034201C58